MTAEQSPDSLKAYIDEHLPAFLPAIAKADGGTAAEAAAYSLAVGGKRIRPVLLLAAAQMCGVAKAEALPFAAAVEMIHTYSLIHDDLPAMDNDLLRRGRPSCHAAFGEANAILAGDGLLNLAYETLFEALVVKSTPERLAAAAELARAAGFRGMVGGQCLDLSESLHEEPDKALYTIQRKKTGALIRAAVLAGARLGAAGDDVSGQLTDFADALGLSFQIKDDLLDVQSTSGTLGKTTGKDARDGKLTFVTRYGGREAERIFAAEMARARAALSELEAGGLFVTTLRAIWRYLEQRTV